MSGAVRMKNVFNTFLVALMSVSIAWSIPLDSGRYVSLNPKGYLCRRTAKPIIIDGELNDASWDNASWTDDFVDIEGNEKPKPRFRTRVKMLWDDRYLYVGAELEEPHIWATLLRRDTVIFYDNDFEIFIDPNGDNHEYYEFEMNAYNTGWDLFLPKPYRDGGSARDDWDIIGLKTAVHIDGTINDPQDTDRGWSLEMAIPWSALKEYARTSSPPNEGDRWRINFSRVEWITDIVNGKYQKVKDRKEDNWVWSPQGVINMHCPEQWGYVQFARAEAGKAQFVPDPSLPAREALINVYYAQKKYFELHKKYAVDFSRLLLPHPHFTHKNISGFRMKLTDEGFTAFVTLKTITGKTERWSIGQDSKIRKQ